nr:hypothetical protein [uncultured Acetatifactor sp.]
MDLAHGGHVYKYIWLYKRLYTKNTEIVIIMAYIRVIVTGGTPWPSILTKNSPILIYIYNRLSEFQKAESGIGQNGTWYSGGTSPKEFQKAA